MTAGVAAAATWNDIGISGLAGGGFNYETGILIMAVKIDVWNEVNISAHSLESDNAFTQSQKVVLLK